MLGSTEAGNVPCATLLHLHLHLIAAACAACGTCLPSNRLTEITQQPRRKDSAQQVHCRCVVIRPQRHQVAAQSGSCPILHVMQHHSHLDFSRESAFSSQCAESCPSPMCMCCQCRCASQAAHTWCMCQDQDDCLLMRAPLHACM